MNAAIRQEIRERVSDHYLHHEVVSVEPIVDLVTEFYIRGGTDALRIEIDRVRADTAAKIAAVGRVR